MNDLRILIVDDDPELCRVAGWSLESMATCAFAHDLASAEQLLEADSFDLAVIDVALGRDSGLALLDEIRMRWPEVAATMISGTDDLALAQTALARGAIAYLVKPFRVNDLRIHVAGAVAAHRRMRADRSSPRARIVDELQLMLSVGDGADVICAVVEFQQLPLVSSRGRAASEELTKRLAQLDLRLIDLSLVGMLDKVSFVVAGRRDSSLALDEAAALVRQAMDATDQTPSQLGHFAPRFVVGVSARRDDAEALLTEAEASARSALEQHVSAVMFTSQLGEAARDELELASDLARAIEQRTIQLAYQPQFLSTSLWTIGIEALARWRHPTRGDVPPATFVPVAERNGLIGALGEYVLRSACRDAVAFGPASNKGPRVSVNVSVAQLHDPRFVETVLAALTDSGLPPGRLCLEVTESLVLHGTDPQRDRFEQLAAHGIRWSLDDFGTGFSTFETLSDFPWNEIKVDSGLTAQVNRHCGREILRSIVAMATRLRMDVVAEGVETTAQLEALRALGFGTVQGFLLGRPVPLAELRRRLAASAHDDRNDSPAGLRVG